EGEVDAGGRRDVAAGKNTVARRERPAGAGRARDVVLKARRLEYSAEVEIVAAIQRLRSGESAGLAVAAIAAAVGSVLIGAARATHVRTNGDVADAMGPGVVHVHAYAVAQTLLGMEDEAVVASGPTRFELIHIGDVLTFLRFRQR